MEVTVGLFLLLICMAFICEFVDSSLGMGYWTILAPVLIIMGFEPLFVVPAILFSQAIGGFSAAVFHHLFKNVDFHPSSTDTKIVFLITSLGIFATVAAAFIAMNIPKTALNTYIGILILLMGVILLTRARFKFSWKGMVGIGILSAFNKSISGGGFGPVVTAGQIIAGHKCKNAIGITTLAEAPICIAGFFTYVIVKSVKYMTAPVLQMPASDFFKVFFSSNIIDWQLLISLSIGALLVTPFGAFTTRKIDVHKIKIFLGILITVLGCWLLVKTYLG